MPRYFFDLIDGDRLDTDETGLEFDSLEEAQRQAASLLPAIARDEIPDGDSRDFQIAVKDVQGRLVYTATLSFRGDRHPGSS